MRTRVGILGIGHLAGYLLRGFLRAGLDPRDLLLSPGGRAAEAATEHGIAVAPDNTALVEACDVLILSVRPAQATDALRALPFRSGQCLISACAGVPLADLHAAAPAAKAIRAMPISAAVVGASPTPIFPEDSEARALLARLGPVIAVADEAALKLATAEMAVYGWVHALIGATAAWAEARGLSEATARDLAASTFKAAALMVAEEKRPVSAMVAGLATPGGITETGLTALRSAGVEEAWAEACEKALDKLKG